MTDRTLHDPSRREMARCEREIAGCDHIVASSDGLFAIDRRGYRQLLAGRFDGVATIDSKILALENVGSAGPSGGRIVRLRHDGRRIERVDILAQHLPYGCHGIAPIDGDLFVIEPGGRHLLRFALDGMGPDILRPLPPSAPGPEADTIAALLGDGDAIVLLINGAASRRIVVLDRTCHRIATLPLVGRGGHDIAVLDDGRPVVADAMSGSLIDIDGPAMAICDAPIRSLSIDATQIVVGRVLATPGNDPIGAVDFLDCECCLVATIEVPGAVTAIRRLDGQDRGPSRALDLRMFGTASANPGLLRRALSSARRYLSGGAAWSELATRIACSGVHQDNALTSIDRYPLLFDLAAELLVPVPTPRILSFGCSSGEEVLSLQCRMPRAALVGAEINRARLRACRRLPADPNRTFIASTGSEIAAHGPYHAIFCLAVLTRRPHEIHAAGIRDIAVFYPFRHFRETLAFLVDQLRDGGLLVVEHSLYRVEDLASELGIVPVPGVATYIAKGPRFTPEGRRIERQPVISRIFRKKGALAARPPA